MTVRRASFRTRRLWCISAAKSRDHCMYHGSSSATCSGGNTDDVLKRRMLRELHDHWGAGHPGRDETTRQVQHEYFWPLGRAWIARYIKGCATCQQNKNLTHVTKTPLYKITVPENAPPFTQIAMDLITGLPKSRGYDTILTIVDHGCSRGAIFLPCNTTITGPQIVQLYYKHVYPWFGLPTKVISDRDP